MQAQVASTDVSVGANRFVMGLIQVGKGNELPKPLPEGDVVLRFLYPVTIQPNGTGSGTLKGEAKAVPQSVGDKSRVLYVSRVTFDQPGQWAVNVSGTSAGQPIEPATIAFQVKPKPVTPELGAPAPRSRNLTRKDVDDIKKICSLATPNDLEMHELSIAEALEQKKPLVVAFSTPGYCTTQTCAPQLAEVQQLSRKYNGQVNFVHVEIFKDPQTRTVYEAVNEWALTSEPWTFFVDRNGLIADKFEGPAPVSEMEPALLKLLQ